MQWILALYFASLVYSALRYVAFNPENAGNVPVFVMNKGVSMAAALCFMVAFLQQRRMARGARGIDPAFWFRAGVFGVFAHVPMSLVVLRPGYFREFFDGERLSFGGEAVFFFGAMTAGGIYLLHRAASWQPMTRWWLSLATLCALFGHVVAMGICRGMNINASHAYLPPMWLLSLIGVLAGLAFLISARPGSGASSPPPPR